MVARKYTGRQVIIDTETTGLVPSDHRIIEIGIVELVNRRPTGRVFHEYVDPEMEIPQDAVEVHGMTREAVIAAGNGQKFQDIVSAFLEFIGDAELIIHNAPFDMGFLDAEMARCGLPPLTGRNTVFDTLKLASVKHAGQRNTLDALCKRYGIDNQERSLHGALLDATLLAQVYLPLTTFQAELGYGQESPQVSSTEPSKTVALLSAEQTRSLTVISASEEEVRNHEALMKRIAKESKADPLWVALSAIR